MSERAGIYVQRVRRELKQQGSAAVARQTQRFFKHPVKAYGWRTASVRKLAARLRHELVGNADRGLLFEVAERFFAGPSVEEATLGVALLRRSVKNFGETEFRRLEKWLGRVKDWSGCDALCCDLLGPLIVVEPQRIAQVRHWTRSKNVWHRRAAAVALVPAARQRLHTPEIFAIADRLLEDDEEMVQKGVGWLLREAGKADPRPIVKYLARVKRRAPRLVLRTACEKLSAGDRKRILG